MPHGDLPVLNLAKFTYTILSLRQIGNCVILGTGKTGNIYVLGATV
jgi:hypothetical protein